jgi:hypothetical protein
MSLAVMGHIVGQGQGIGNNWPHLAAKPAPFLAAISACRKTYARRWSGGPPSIFGSGLF